MKKLKLLFVFLISLNLFGCSIMQNSHKIFSSEEYPNLKIEALHNRTTFETTIKLYQDNNLVSEKIYERLNINEGVSYFQVRNLNDNFKLTEIENEKFKCFKNITIKLDNDENIFQIIDYTYYGEKSRDNWILNDNGKIEGIATIGEDHEYSVILTKEYTLLYSKQNIISKTDIEYNVLLFLYEEEKIYHQIYLTHNQEETEFTFCLEYTDQYGIGREVTNYIYMVKIIEENMITFEAIKNEKI